MRMNFGPINNAGGEKRLNVIFSRARRHMVLVSSIDHTAITNVYNDGAKTLRGFLHYADAVSNGDAAAADGVLAGLRERSGRATVPVVEPDRGADRRRPARGRCRRRRRCRAVGVPLRPGPAPAGRPGAHRRRAGRPVRAARRRCSLDERRITQPTALRSGGWRVLQVLGAEWESDPDGVVRGWSPRSSLPVRPATRPCRPRRWRPRVATMTEHTPHAHGEQLLGRALRHDRPRVGHAPERGAGRRRQRAGPRAGPCGSTSAPGTAGTPSGWRRSAGTSPRSTPHPSRSAGSLQAAADAGLADRVTVEQHDLRESMPTGRFDLVTATYLHGPAAVPADARCCTAPPSLVAPGGLLLVVEHASVAPVGVGPGRGLPDAGGVAGLVRPGRRLGRGAARRPAAHGDRA